MRNFDYCKLAKVKWDNEIINLVSKIHECKGRQDLFVRQKPQELKRLVEIARIQSTESSNKIEGIITTNTRIKQLVNDKTTPRNRDEDEIIGYRDVLNTIHENYDVIPIRPSYILQLHRDLLKKAKLNFAGHFKTTQNYISETKADGSANILFVPLAPYETEPAIDEICENYNQVISLEKIDPLILIPIFIVDFLCIHPFNDGNGRMSRLLTLLMLYQNGYVVGKYISIEKQIEKTKDLYYDALQESDKGWNEENNDPTPFIRYLLRVILACYVEFEERITIADDAEIKSTTYDVVKVYVERTLGKFTSSDVIYSCPSASRSSILAVLKKLTEEGFIKKEGNARNTYYVKKDSIVSSK